MIAISVVGLSVVVLMLAWLLDVGSVFEIVVVMWVAIPHSFSWFLIRYSSSYFLITLIVLLLICIASLEYPSKLL